MLFLDLLAFPFHPHARHCNHLHVSYCPRARWGCGVLNGLGVSREMLTHENVTFNDNGTLTASPSHPLVWTPELSEGRREDDQLILPNIALLVSDRQEIPSFAVFARVQIWAALPELIIVFRALEGREGFEAICRMRRGNY